MALSLGVVCCRMRRPGAPARGWPLASLARRRSRHPVRPWCPPGGLASRPPRRTEQPKRLDLISRAGKGRRGGHEPRPLAAARQPCSFGYSRAVRAGESCLRRGDGRRDALQRRELGRATGHDGTEVETLRLRNRVVGVAGPSREARCPLSPGTSNCPCFDRPLAREASDRRESNLVRRRLRST